MAASDEDGGDDDAAAASVGALLRLRGVVAATLDLSSSPFLACDTDFDDLLRRPSLLLVEVAYQSAAAVDMAARPMTMYVVWWWLLLLPIVIVVVGKRYYWRVVLDSTTDRQARSLSLIFCRDFCGGCGFGFGFGFGSLFLDLPRGLST